MPLCTVCKFSALEGEHKWRWRRVGERIAQKMQRFVLEPSVQEKFPLRDFAAEPVSTADQLCGQSGCMYLRFYAHSQKVRQQGERVRGSSCQWLPPPPQTHLKRRRLDRYCTSAAAMEALIARVEIAGTVLDLCGGSDDGLAAAFAGRCRVMTNDVDATLSADSHDDATLPDFAERYLGRHGGEKPDWVVTSPPYKGAIKYVQAALAVCSKGAALKLPLSFLEPCKDRGSWLVENPPSCCIFFRRGQADHYGALKVGEFWGVWERSGASLPTRERSAFLFTL